MGNFISCNFAAPKLRSPKAARVILPGGQIQQFRHPIKAADLMLDNPNYFLVNSASFNIGRRFSALSADDDLVFGSLYLMLPMRRLNSIVTAADVAVFLVAANAAPKRLPGNGISVRVSPVVAAAAAIGDSSDRGRMRLGFVEEAAAPEFKHRLAACRSKRPDLDTIAEEEMNTFFLFNLR